MSLMAGASERRRWNWHLARPARCIACRANLAPARSRRARRIGPPAIATEAWDDLQMERGYTYYALGDVDAALHIVHDMCDSGRLQRARNPANRRGSMKPLQLRWATTRPARQVSFASAEVLLGRVPLSGDSSERPRLLDDALVRAQAHRRARGRAVGHDCYLGYAALAARRRRSAAEDQRTVCTRRAAGRLGAGR